MPGDSDPDRNVLDVSNYEEDSPGGRKRSRKPPSDARYPRKRSSRACHVCRARKTKCDNRQPSCGFCAALNIPCSYDITEKDHSSFDPATLEILRQLGQIINNQDDILHNVRSIATSQPRCMASHPSQFLQTHGQTRPFDGSATWTTAAGINMQNDASTSLEWSIHDPETISTSPFASAGVAAVRWFDILANDATREELVEADGPLGLEGLLGSSNVHHDEHMSPLQCATRIIDGQTEDGDRPSPGLASGELLQDLPEERLWQAPEGIRLLDSEQLMFQHLLHRICPWLDLFDPARTFSTRVPHLALRNAGLLNAIMALSAYHQSLDENINRSERPNQNSALQYYYQTLHYVQKAMRYTTYQNSKELMATTLIISTYEMLRGSRKDWEQHLQGVFWILRSRQIEVEKSSLESTTWWAWLQQDIWVAFREKRRTYSTWTPNKPYSELSSHELASRALWILAQVINFCALEPSDHTEIGIERRRGWAQALKKMLQDWQSYLTVEFSPLPSMIRSDGQAFQPRLIHPPCFGSAMQVHHVSKILICAHEPSLGGIDSFMSRQRTIQDSIEIVCGIGMTLVDDASSMLSSQCLFISGMFLQIPQQRTCVLEMLKACRNKCLWPTPSLGTELEQMWQNGCP